ncbi:hypothetical protein WA577_004106 [Blastocystis sp. JDR]
MFQKNYSDSYAELQTVRAETKNEVTFWQKLIVGGSSGVLATSLVYPLDVVKTTMQRQVVGKSVLYKNPIQAAKGIVSFNGVSGLYKGIGVNLVGMFPVQALRLAGNDLLRDLLADADGRVSTVRGMLAGAGAGCMQVIASNPMEITKIRLQVQNTLPLAERKNVAGVLRELGLRGVYKGSSITLLRDVPFLMMFFPLQASLVQAFTPQHGSCSIGGLFAAGYLAGMTSAFVLTPMDVMKTRVQSAKGSSMESSVLKMLVSTVKNEGVRALYKGATMRMAVLAPMFAIMTTAFEVQKRIMGSM